MENLCPPFLSLNKIYSNFLKKKHIQLELNLIVLFLRNSNLYSKYRQIFENILIGEVKVTLVAPLYNYLNTPLYLKTPTINWCIARVFLYVGQQGSLFFNHF